MRSTGADVAEVQKCDPVRDKVGCTGACGKLCPTTNPLDQNQCNSCSVYSVGTSTVIVKQKEHVTAQLSAQLGHPNKSNFQGQYQGHCIKAQAKDEHHCSEIRTSDILDTFDMAYHKHDSILLTICSF